MATFEASRDQAQSLLAQTRPAEAMPILQRLVRQHPDDPQTNNLLAIAFNQTGQPQSARFYIERALRRAPGDPALLATLARSEVLLGRHDAAAAILRDGLAAHPEDTRLTVDLGLLMVELGRCRDAVDVLRTGAVAQEPAVLAALSTALKRLGRTDEAIEAAVRSHGWSPDKVSDATVLATLTNYSPTLARSRILDAHRHAARRIAEVSRLARQPVPLRPLAGRPLRVGLLSGDFREHSVAYFVEPILRHADPAQTRFVLYHLYATQDDVTRRLTSYAERLRPVLEQPSDVLAQTIRSDAIDVLIDLAGLTDGNRLQTLCLKPASVQVTAIGYPNTTGLSTIDWRLVDSLTDPPGAEQLAVERLWRLDPCFLCYSPPPEAPEPGPLRGDDTPVTFGSFNALKKINQSVLRVWASILSRVPASRLILKNSDLGDAQTRDDFVGRLAAAGADPSRVELVSWTPTTADHLRLYHRVDVALDTFPYNGTTTTCEALLMSVPVVALSGDRHAARVGLSLLTNAGLPGLVAESQAAYTDLAVALALDRPRLAAVRSGLRERFLRSPVCDGPGYADRFTAGLRRLRAAVERGGGNNASA